MIDTNSESIITLTEAARLLPHRRAGRPVHVSCIYRWCQNGVRGVCLEFTQIGATKCTSREALQRFFDALTTQVEFGRGPVPTPPKMSSQRRKQIEAAEKRLQAAGI
jgi:hypothetical protein